MRLATVGILCMLAFAGCARSSPPPADPNLIDCSGVYPSPSLKYRVVVPRGTGVQYSIWPAAGDRAELEHRNRAGRHMWWFLYWGEDDSLWHYTGDNGEFMVWQRDAQGVWVRHDVVWWSDDGSSCHFDDELIGRMPVGVLRNLDPSAVEEWGLKEVQDAAGKVRVTRDLPPLPG